MKYIKTYERLLHFNDPQVVNHPLLNLTIELDKILRNLQNLDNYKKSTVKKYFNPNGDISLCYKDSGSRNLFLVKILNIKEIYTEYNDDVVMIINKYNHFINNYNKNSDLLSNYIIDLFKDYIYDNKVNKTFLRFSKTEIDNIVKKMQKVDIFFDTIKYNL